VQTLWETIFVPGFEPFAAGVLPQTVGSHFERFCRRAQKIKYKSGGLRVMGTAFYDHEQIKFYLAFAQEAGEIIIGSQHGGSYGIDRFHFSSFELEIKHKLFLSWGWESQDSVQKNVLPLSSPLCSRYAEKHRFKNDSVILVSTHIWPLGLGLYYSELIGSDWLDYVRRKIELISTFSPSLRDRFFYRAHPHKRASLSELPTLKKEFPDLKLCEGPLKNHLLSTSLLILDNPSTTLNFAAAANTPFVLVLHPKTAFCSEAEPFFRDFEKAGMLFSSPKSAAEHINRLGDIPSWWHSSEVQSARKRWCEKYARTNPQVFFEWAKTLWNL
jgi:putative transferase (TIGR04331 family)